ncbi:MAG: ATP-binding protein [Lachnospiraceae bacterium]|nr:ATP-binding protein [Lachnospiraceae bacterium]
MKSITLRASYDNLQSVMGFVNSELDQCDCDITVKMQIQIAVEEIFVNISDYAYAPDTGDVEICCELRRDPDTLILQFKDQGVPFNPLELPDPDRSSEALMERIGGLGVFMLRQYMNDVRYSYENGRNVLTVERRLDYIVEL